jgi:polysaccharide biosynthesis transport protein
MPKNKNNLNDHINKLMNFLDQDVDESQQENITPVEETVEKVNIAPLQLGSSEVLTVPVNSSALAEAIAGNAPASTTSRQNLELKVLLRQKWVVIITTMAVMVVVAIGLIFTSPIYESTAKIRIMTAISGGKDNITYDLTYTERLMQTYAQIAKSGPVTTELITRLNTTVKDLPKTTISLIPDTELLSITAEDKVPENAMKTANTLADILITHSKELFAKTSVESVTLMESAAIPTIPTKPSKPLFLVVGLLFGLIAGVGLAFAIESMDTLLYSMDQIEAATRLPLVGDIPEYRYPIQEGDVIIDNTLHAEAFSRLRTNLIFSARKNGLRTFLVTSVVKGDGKSTIISNLAISIAKTGRKVLVIDADFRNPELHKFFSIDNLPGLSEFLVEKAKFKDAVKHTKYDGLDVVPGGSTPEDPAEVLGRPDLANLIKYAETVYDIILIDVAGSLAVTDSTVIAPLIGGILLVVRINYVRRDVLTNTIKNLKNINANFVGVVVNRTTRGVGTKFDKRIEKAKEERPIPKLA